MQALHGLVDSWQTRAYKVSLINFSPRERLRSRQAIDTYPGRHLIRQLAIRHCKAPNYWYGDNIFTAYAPLFSTPDWNHRLVRGSTPFKKNMMIGLHACWHSQEHCSLHRRAEQHLPVWLDLYVLGHVVSRTSCARMPHTSLTSLTHSFTHLTHSLTSLTSLAHSPPSLTSLTHLPPSPPSLTYLPPSPPSLTSLPHLPHLSHLPHSLTPSLTHSAAVCTCFPRNRRVYTMVLYGSNPWQTVVTSDGVQNCASWHHCFTTCLILSNFKLVSS